MRPARLLFAAAVTAAALAGTPALAAAAPPANDNYLSSLPVDKTEFTATADTTEATTQPDVFNPSRDGQPLGGGAPEPLDCKGTSFGKTVWYDLAPQVDGGVQIRATGFQTVVAVYEWNARDSKITRLVDCSANAGADDLLIDVEGKKNYTIQVGGAGGAGGLMNLKVDFFPDTDSDSVLDALDKCPKVPGIERFGGCPPELRVVPSIGFDGNGAGITIKRLIVDKVPKGAKVVARCTPGCGSQTIKAKRLGRVSLTRFVGRSAPAGAKVSIRVTLGRTGKGRYVFGATGSYFEWPVRAGGLGPRRTRCLNVKTSKIERCQ